MAREDSDQIDISILIANWNTRDLLGQCLESIEQNIRVRDDIRVETIVVDNASMDGSVDLVRNNFPNVTLIENNRNVGFAVANNQALRLARGDYLLFLNSDTEIIPDMLGQMKTFFERFSQVGAIGPLVLNMDGSIQNCYGKLPGLIDEIVGPNLLDTFIRPWGKIGRFRTKTNQCRPVDRVSFACTMTRRSAQQDIGELDERFEFYSEDFDWFKRLKDAGWTVLFCPSVRVKHHGGASSSQRSDWSWMKLFRGKRLYIIKHFGSREEKILRAGLVLRFLTKILTGMFRYPIDRQSSLRQVRLYSLLFQDTLIDLE